MRPNWFVGLPVRTVWFPEALGPAPPKVRLLHPEDLHVTVAFFGGCTEADAMHAWSLAQHHRGPAGLVATAARVVALGSPNRPSALSALLDDGHRELAAFMLRHRAAWLVAAGVRPDRRAPLPHFTLARPQRRASEAQRTRAIGWGTSRPVAGRTLELGPLTLYTWAEDRRQRLLREVGIAG